MATFEQIAEVRVRIDDPSGFASILSVADVTALPAAPQAYTAYRVEDTGAYVSTDKTSGAVAADYETVDIYVSDARIEAWIDAESVDFAECRGYHAIASKIGRQMELVRNTSGAETEEFQGIAAMHNYYKGLAKDCEQRKNEDTGNNTGRYGATSAVSIGGGNL